MREPDVVAALLGHSSSVTGAAPDVIRVDGRVRRPFELHVVDLEALVQQVLLDDFTGLKGWTVSRLAWQGVPLAAILELAEVDADTRWIQASSRGHSVPIPLDDARGAVLALRLDEQPVPTVHGGPIRLFVPGRECFTSVKWLDHREARVVPATHSAPELALGRW